MNRKLWSGKFLFTVASAAVFVYTAVTGRMDPADINMILGIVITFYFAKDHGPSEPTGVA